MKKNFRNVVFVLKKTLANSVEVLFPKKTKYLIVMMLVD